MKAKAMLALVAACWGTSALAKVEVAQRDGVTTYQFAVDAVRFEDVDVWGETVTKATLDGVDGYTGVLYDEGKPAVPVIRLFVDGDGPIDVTVGAADEGLVTAKHRALPALAPVPKIPGARRQLKFDAETYDDDAPYPALDFEVKAIGTIRGVARRMVTLYPVHVDAKANKWQIAQKFTVTANVKVPAQQPTAQGETLALVIGEQFEQSPSLAAYVKLKESLGYVVKTIVFRKGRSTPDEIRGALQAELTRRDVPPLRYALIVGDNQDVPGHESDVISGVTDHYYASIDTSDYASDIGTPDIGVGRISVSTEEDLAKVLAKMERYERGAFKDPSWLKQIEWIASDDPWYWGVAEGSFDYVIDRYTVAQGFTGTFPDMTTAGGDKLYAITHKATSAQVVERMRAGRGFINYGGHGSTDSWAGPEVTAEDVLSMSHAEAIPVVVANACITGQFTEDSFAEVWQRHPQGAVMYWGSMDSTYWDEDDILQRALYDYLYRDQELEFARFTEDSVLAVWRHYGGEGLSKYYFETYVTFGDPSQKMRNAPATTVTAQAQIQSQGDGATVVVKVVDQSGAPVRNARVALSQAEQVLGLGYTGADGTVKLKTAQSALTMQPKVTVSGPNLGHGRDLIVSL